MPFSFQALDYVHLKVDGPGGANPIYGSSSRSGSKYLYMYLGSPGGYG